MLTRWHVHSFPVFYRVWTYFWQHVAGSIVLGISKE